MTEEQIEQHAVRFSQTYKNDKQYGKSTSKWSDPLARPTMCKKTVLKLLLGTYGLMTTEFAKALDSDNDEEVTHSGQRFEDAEIVTQDDPQGQEDEPKRMKL